MSIDLLYLFLKVFYLGELNGQLRLVYTNHHHFLDFVRCLVLFYCRIMLCTCVALLPVKDTSIDGVMVMVRVAQGVIPDESIDDVTVVVQV